ELSTLRWLISNAEALPAGMCREWNSLYPQVCLLNTYGATECSDDTSHYLVQQLPEEDWAYSPLGNPINNMTTYLLDAWMNPVPAGLAGEIYLGGAGVGRGYLKRASLTAERFVPDP